MRLCTLLCILFYLCRNKSNEMAVLPSHSNKEEGQHHLSLLNIPITTRRLLFPSLSFSFLLSPFFFVVVLTRIVFTIPHSNIHSHLLLFLQQYPLAPFRQPLSTHLPRYAAIATRLHPSRNPDYFKRREAATLPAPFRFHRCRLTSLRQRYRLGRTF